MLKPPPLTCGSVGDLLAAPGAFGNNDLFQVVQLRQTAGDGADLGFAALFARTVDRGSGEGLALHTLTGHLKQKATLVNKKKNLKSSVCNSVSGLKFRTNKPLLCGFVSVAVFKYHLRMPVMEKVFKPL